MQKITEIKKIGKIGIKKKPKQNRKISFESIFNNISQTNNKNLSVNLKKEKKEKKEIFPIPELLTLQNYKTTTYNLKLQEVKNNSLPLSKKENFKKHKSSIAFKSIKNNSLFIKIKNLKRKKSLINTSKTEIKNEKSSKVNQYLTNKPKNNEKTSKKQIHNNKTTRTLLKSISSMKNKNNSVLKPKKENFSDTQNINKPHTFFQKSNTLFSNTLNPSEKLLQGNQSQIMNQIKNEVLYSFKKSENKVFIKLTPSKLGHLEIKILQNKEKTKISIKVQNRETYNLLSQNQDILKTLFSEIKKTQNELSFSFDGQKRGKHEEKNHDKTKFKEKTLKYSENGTINNYAGIIEIIV